MHGELVKIQEILKSNEQLEKSELEYQRTMRADLETIKNQVAAEEKKLNESKGRKKVFARKRLQQLKKQEQEMERILAYDKPSLRTHYKTVMASKKDEILAQIADPSLIQGYWESETEKKKVIQGFLNTI